MRAIRSMSVVLPVHNVFVKPIKSVGSINCCANCPNLKENGAKKLLSPRINQLVPKLT